MGVGWATLLLHTHTERESEGGGGGGGGGGDRATVAKAEKGQVFSV